MRNLISLHKGRVSIHKNYCSFNNELRKDTQIVGGRMKPIILEDYLSRQMGGLLIGDSNVSRGGKIRPPQRRPIRFLV